MARALSEYRDEYRDFSARVVLHKSSNLNDAEVRGFEAAADERHLGLLEPIWVQSFVAQQSQRPWHGIGVHTEHGGEILAGPLGDQFHRPVIMLRRDEHDPASISVLDTLVSR